MNRKILSLSAKILIIVSAIIGVVLSAVRTEEFMGGSTVFLYFTIQSNLAIAVVSLIGTIFLLKGIDNRIWQVIKLVFTVSITLTGVVFCFVLAPTMGVAAWNVQNVLTHVVVPIVSITDLLVFSNESKLQKFDIFYVTIPPLCYAIFAGFGYALKWDFGQGVHYPYFFLNWGSEAGAFSFSKELPFMGCAYWILLLLGFLILVGFIYAKILKKTGKK